MNIIRLDLLFINPKSAKKPYTLDEKKFVFFLSFVITNENDYDILSTYN